MKKITLICTLTLLNFVSFTAHAQTYCASRGTNTTHGYIKEVQMSGGINNTSGNNGGYADFTAQSATLFIGVTNNIALTPGFISGAAFFEYWTIYIDYNHDGIFEPSEIVGQKNGGITAHKAFTVPATALKGRTRMRIQMQAGMYETDPCATYTYGEVEDYTIDIKGSAALSAGTNSDIKKISTENNTDLRLYPNPAKDNLTVEYKSSGNGKVKVNVYNLSGQKVINIENPSVKGLTIYNLNTSKLGSGFYIFEMENNGQRQHQKFFISR